MGLDQQTVTVVCTNRRRKFLLDTADASLTMWVYLYICASCLYWIRYKQLKYSKVSNFNFHHLLWAMHSRLCVPCAKSQHAHLQNLNYTCISVVLRIKNISSWEIQNIWQNGWLLVSPLTLPNPSVFNYSWFLSVLKSAMVKGCCEPPYPSVLTDATMEKLALTKFVSQESHCEVKTR